MTNDPVIHDQHLNQAFRSDVPKKPEPESDTIKISWVEVVPKFTRLRGVQLTDENMEDIAKLHGWDYYEAHRGLSASVHVPGTTGDVKAFVGEWILIADDNWDMVTVCSKQAFTRSYEVKS